MHVDRVAGFKQDPGLSGETTHTAALSVLAPALQLRGTGPVVTGTTRLYEKIREKYNLLVVFIEEHNTMTIVR